jgi:predicted nucleotidyltransferase
MNEQSTMAERIAIKQAVAKASLFSDRIRAALPIRDVFLYGSFAKGNPREESDIDVGVVLDSSRTNDLFATGLRLWQEAHAVDVRIEPFCILSEDYDSCEPASILAEIKRTAVNLKARRAKF